MFYVITLPLLFLISALYASVGLGGGTAFLAILSFWSVDPNLLRPIAWGLNIIGAAVGLCNFSRQGHADWGLSMPLSLCGMAGAAWGASIALPVFWFRWLLGLLLLFAAGVMWLDRNCQVESKPLSHPLWLVFSIGVGVGAISGLAGIGGGILLGPLLILLRWQDAKQTAATTSLYILLISASALLSFLFHGGSLLMPPFIYFAVSVLAGSAIGSFYGAGQASGQFLKTVFAAIAIIAAVRLIAG